jgi:Uncharacterized protein conserved in bacteria C-term(DUF2220)
MTPFEAQIFARLLTRAKGSKFGRVTTEPALKMLSSAFPDPIELRKALNGLRNAGKLTFSRGSRGEPVSPFITVHAPEADLSAHQILWRSVAATLSTDEAELAILEPLGDSLEGFDEAHMRDLVHCLHALRSDHDRLNGRPLFEVSAGYLLGSSKLLSSLDARCLRHFGIRIADFPSRPPYLLVASAPAPTAVILVENPVAFELAVSSRAAQTCTFVCTFGFGLSNGGNEYGFQLANIVNANQAIILHRTQGMATDLATLLSHPNVQFWGDLDMAGMQIFERLAKRIPHITLSALYQPMLEAIANPLQRHPYAMATGKGGQALYIPRRDDAQAVASRCQVFAVDQEIVGTQDIEALAGQILQRHHPP